MKTILYVRVASSKGEKTLVLPDTKKKLNTDHLNSKIFLDPNGEQAIARYDRLKYQRIDKMTKNQMGQFWIPEEIDLSRDKIDFRSLQSHEEHIFTSNLFRQIILDTKQGKAPSEMFLPIVTNPETEAFIEMWSAFESIHNRSYTHIIRNVYPDPSEVFDNVFSIPEIVECAESISHYYDALDKMNTLKKAFELGCNVEYDEYEHKKAVWRALIAVNALEGLRFYVSFACSWNFAQLKKMAGNANIIKLIARDENVHLMFTQYLLNVLPKDDEDFDKISKSLEGESIQIYVDVVEQEKEWAKYLFQKGSMIGLNERVAGQYIEWLCNQRMRAINLKSPYKGEVTSNPLPWTEQWIGSKSVQNANQENENTMYVVGGLEPDSDKIDVKKDFDPKKLLGELK